MLPLHKKKTWERVLSVNVSTERKKTPPNRSGASWTSRKIMGRCIKGDCVERHWSESCDRAKDDIGARRAWRFFGLEGHRGGKNAETARIGKTAKRRPGPRVNAITTGGYDRGSGGRQLNNSAATKKRKSDASDGGRGKTAR